MFQHGAFLLLALLGPTSLALGSSDSLSIGFVENCGQLDEAVAYRLSAAGSDAFFTSEGVTFSWFAGDPELRVVLRLRVEGRSPGVHPIGRERYPGVVNDLRGSDSKRHVLGAPTFAAVAYEEIYPGIDLVYRHRPTLKAEWIVRPGAEVASIRFRYEGAAEVSVEGDSLVIRTAAGDLREMRPLFYQDGPEGRRPIPGGFRVNDGGVIGFWVGAHDPSLALVLDPDLEWSTFLGGTDTEAIEHGGVDRSGNVYLAGWNLNGSFPTTPGAFQTLPASGHDAIVAKVSANGSTLLWATYLGGSDDDNISQIVVDASGDVYIGGSTNSSDFPVTPGAFDTTYNGGASFLYGDAFVAKLSSSGSALLYATYLGGSESDICNALTIDGSGAAIVVGRTYSASFPTKSAYDKTYNGGGDITLTKLDPTGSTLVFSTFLGGTGFEQCYDIARDRAGDLYITGETQSTDYPTTAGSFNPISGSSILTKLDAAATGLVYSTYLAPEGRGETVTVDSSFRAIVGGDTGDLFPATSGAYDTTFNTGFRDAFVLMMEAAGDKLVYATYLGGYDSERVNDVIFGNGRATVVGSTFSRNFPVTPGAYDRVHGGYDRNVDVFVTELNEDGSELIYSTFLGGSEHDGSNAIFFSSGAPREVTVIGYTYSSGFPATPGAYDTSKAGGSDTPDGFALRMRLGPVIELAGTPSPGNSIHYDVLGAPSSEAGLMAQVVLSCSGSFPGVLLPGGLILPINPDACTNLGLDFGFLLRTSLATDGTGSTPIFTFPSVPAGITVTSAAFTWNPMTGIVFSVTAPIEFVTL